MKEFKKVNFELDDGYYWDEDWATPYDFINQVIGNYLILKKVKYCSYKSNKFDGTNYYLCKNIKTNLYSLKKHTIIEQIYREASSSSYLGMNYAEEDAPFYMTIDSFISGFGRFRSKDAMNDNFYRDEILIAKKCFSLNTSFFDSIDNAFFLKELNRIVQKYGFKKVESIPTTKNCLYLMVVGKYKQFYVGKCVSSASSRIRRHWRSNMRDYHFFVSMEYERLPIDAFKMFDTTEVYILDDFKKVKADPNFATVSKYELVKNHSNCHKRVPELDELSLVERTVVNECNLCCSLNDRTPILTFKNYSRLEDYFGKNRYELKIKDFNDYSFKHTIFR